VVFSDPAKAIAEAKAVADRLDKQEGVVVEIHPKDRLSYESARRYLDPIGVPVEIAAMEYAAAVAKLGQTPLGEAVDYYLKWGPSRGRKLVEEVVEEFIELKDEARLSERYVKRLKWTLGKFTSRFKGTIMEVQGVEIDSWLRGLGLGPRSRNNVREDIAALFRFAVRRRYLPRDHDELSAVPVLRQPPRDIQVFTPAELVEILRHTPGRIIPFMTLGAFAGVRHAEILRLDWRDVDLEAGHVIVAATKAKTASRRIVPISPNLRAWLAGARKEEGPVCELANMSNEIHDIVVKINERRPEPFQWKQNGLRHSWVSYRLAQTQNADQVALEAGNSRQMIFKHYRELVRPAEALEWFNITPGKVEQAGTEEKVSG
jgi:integrase